MKLLRVRDGAGVWLLKGFRGSKVSGFHTLRLQFFVGGFFLCISELTGRLSCLFFFVDPAPPPPPPPPQDFPAGSNVGPCGSKWQATSKREHVPAFW